MSFRSRMFQRWRPGSVFLCTILVGVGLIGAGVFGISGDALAAEAREKRPVNSVARWHDAKPAERREMREMARERWENASPRERRIYLRGMVALGRALPDFSPIERRVLLRRFFTMSKPDRESLRRRLRRIDDLEPKEREKFVRELRNMLNESPDETVRIERNIDRWREMSESEREKYREQMKRFRAMSAEDRRILLDAWIGPEPD